MPDNVAASMTASIVLDKSDLLAQILKGLSEGQKELQNNKLEMYFDFSNSKNQAGFEKVIQKAIIFTRICCADKRSRNR